MQIYATIEGATHFFSARYVAIARVEMTWGSVFTRLRRDRLVSKLFVRYRGEAGNFLRYVNIFKSCLGEVCHMCESERV